MGRVRFFGIRAIGAIHLASNILVDGETVTIGGRIYEWDNNASVTPGNVLVTIGGTAALSAANLAAAITANKPIVAITATIDPVTDVCIRLVADQQGANGNLTLAEAVTDAGLTLSGALMTGGENAGSQIVHRGEYVVTAIDVLAANVLIATGLTTPKVVEVDLRDVNGVFREDITGQVTVSSGNILHGFEGATDLVAGDRIIWNAWE
jgi:hypothetical protein